jgi:hypothetical protein
MKRFPLVLVLSLVGSMAQAVEASETADTRVVQASESGTTVVMLPGPHSTAKPPAEDSQPTKLPEAKPEQAKAKAAEPVKPQAEPVKPQIDSSVYFPKLIGLWRLADARHALGQPIRQRPSLDNDKTVNGQIYAFADPTSRNKEVELEFAQENGLLREVYIYPAQMTWNDCRRLWGMNVNITQAAKGRTFYSYNNRHLDVLVDTDGKVISLGLY